MIKDKVLVTGCAGFVGSNLTDRLLDENFGVVGLDNFNDYYDPVIKKNNIEKALTSKKFRLYKEDILDYERLKKIFVKEKPSKVIHLAARAGVRPSIENPLLYTQVNVLGTVNLLKLCVETNVSQFIFGSSSSVYGNSTRIPFEGNDECTNIISPYGASKRAAELWVESFHKSYGLKSTVLRFFTVYGPRGRPDMAPAIFSKAVLHGNAINQFGNGSSSRDYTYVDDIVDGIIKSTNNVFDYEIINLGNNDPVPLKEFIKTIELVSGRRVKIKKVENQPGDVEKTWANVAKAKNLLGWAPNTNIMTGMKKYFEFIKVKN